VRRPRRGGVEVEALEGSRPIPEMDITLPIATVVRRGDIAPGIAIGPEGICENACPTSPVRREAEDAAKDTDDVTGAKLSTGITLIGFAEEVGESS
jgi:hypothetical protein